MPLFKFRIVQTFDGLPDGSLDADVYMGFHDETEARAQEVYENDGSHSVVWQRHCPPIYKHGGGHGGLDVLFKGEVPEANIDEIMEGLNRVIYHTREVTPQMYKIITGDNSGRVPEKPTEAEWQTWHKEADLLIEERTTDFKQIVSEITGDPIDEMCDEQSRYYEGLARDRSN